MKNEERAIEMLIVAAAYIREHCPDMLIFYDGVFCDGSCVADDCDNAADFLYPNPHAEPERKLFKFYEE